MNRKTYFFLLLFCISLPLEAANTPPEVRSALRDLLGSKTAASVEVRKSPIPGLFEAMAEGYIFYITKNGHYMIRGEILDLKQDAKNLTEERRNNYRLKAMEQLDENDMVVFPSKGRTKHALTIFTDVDCFYCAKLHRDVPKLNKSGIKVRYLAFPRAGAGSDTYNKMVSVWCAKDQQQAMTKAKAGKSIPSATCKTPIMEQYELGRRMGVNGTPALLLPNGRLLPGYSPPAKLIEFLDKME
ncbi:MAG: DsbC family protein [Gammaproteobacteria bacterium]|nr:DsbC family protein [Gammaproteobacteria bacterium]